jgi:hypothetical protein
MQDERFAGRITLAPAGTQARVDAVLLEKTAQTAGSDANLPQPVPGDHHENRDANATRIPVALRNVLPASRRKIILLTGRIERVLPAGCRQPVDRGVAPPSATQGLERICSLPSGRIFTSLRPMFARSNTMTTI